MKKSRVHFLSVLLLLTFSFIIYKLADIQLISTESYGPKKVNLLDNSVAQRTSQITLTNGRGAILDRNKQPLTNAKRKDVVLFPFVKAIDIPTSIYSAIESFDPNWKKKLENVDEAIFLSELASKEVTNSLYETIQDNAIPGIVAVERTVPNDPNIATHLLGIVRNNPDEYVSRYKDVKHDTNPQPIGISGLEKTFDSFLLSENDEKLMYHVDAKGNPLLGLNLRYQGKEDLFYPAKIQTTIDSEIQSMVESVLDKYRVNKGGVVLLDTETREVVAMASRPKVNQEQPYKDHSLKNQMLTAYFPGSVFKTVVAAAAIEQNKQSTGQQYNCNLNLYGDKSAKRQLGLLSFEESFSQSCNYTFAEIAKLLVEDDRDILEVYANKLGLIGPVGWEGNVFHFQNFKQLAEEENGRVWGNDSDPYVERAIAQTAIGQKEVKVTPLAMANMVATIVNNGIKQEVRVVDKILYNNDTTMIEFNAEKDSENIIKPETALKLKKMLVQVVENGTGWRLSEFPVAGKSGTAQIGKSNRYHHWFTGFFPVENPTYAMTVVDLDQTSEKARTYQVYRDIVKNLLAE